ncbi:MAG: aminotransferase class I/II-fold pyridoxal phosphate-dependent enzyme [Oscillospiraceae bacterium]|nr:aminotransferase class I/II-fold pyridoxal phosphate-dependent enzyme [Oscillospiraceae bacterium]
MFKLPDKVTQLKPYDPITGSYAVRLDANESYFDLPQVLKDKIADQIEQIDFNRYPDPIATEVIEAFAAYYSLSPDCVTAGNGSDEIITLLLNTFMEKGQKLVTVSPDFSMYGVYAELAEIEVMTVQKKENLQIDTDALIAACKEANAVVFSNPCNPTSLGMPRADVVRLIEAVPDCMVIVDEAYMDFWDESVLDLINKYPNLIVLRTCSKAIGLAAARMGFAVMDPYKTGLLRAAKSPYNCDAISQKICATVLKEQTLLQHCRDEIIVQTQRLYTAITELSQRYPDLLETVYAPRTNFVFVKTAYAREIFEQLQKAGIAVRCFPHGLRICAGTRREQTLLISELDRILQPK